MASLIYNYAAIRSRMLGDLKARPEPKKSLCPKCGDVGWVRRTNTGLGTYFIICDACYNPYNPNGLPSP
jgi:hypothetical protein